MLECETGTLLGRVADLEKQSEAQRDEMLCIRSTLADCLRRLALLEGREKREDDRNEKRNERGLSSPLRNGHSPFKSEWGQNQSAKWKTEYSINYPSNNNTNNSHHDYSSASYKTERKFKKNIHVYCEA